MKNLNHIVIKRFHYLRQSFHYCYIISRFFQIFSHFYSYKSASDNRNFCIILFVKKVMNFSNIYNISNRKYINFFYSFDRRNYRFSSHRKYKFIVAFFIFFTFGYYRNLFFISIYCDNFAINSSVNIELF